MTEISQEVYLVKLDGLYSRYDFRDMNTIRRSSSSTAAPAAAPTPTKYSSILYGNIFLYFPLSHLPGKLHACMCACKRKILATHISLVNCVCPSRTSPDYRPQPFHSYNHLFHLVGHKHRENIPHFAMSHPHVKWQKCVFCVSSFVYCACFREITRKREKWSFYRHTGYTSRLSRQSHGNLSQSLELVLIETCSQWSSVYDLMVPVPSLSPLFFWCIVSDIRFVKLHAKRETIRCEREHSAYRSHSYNGTYMLLAISHSNTLHKTNWNYIYG